jgi:hypothetical protein
MKIFYYHIVMDCILIISILVLIAIIATSSREMYKTLKNKSFSGMKNKDIFKPPVDGNKREDVIDECKKYCDGKEDCNGFVLYDDNTCGMLDSNVQAGHLTSGAGTTATTYLKGEADFEPLGYDVKGGNQLKTIEDTNIKKCKKMCKDNKKCKGLIYDKASRACVLKKKMKKDKNGQTILKKIMGQSEESEESEDNK